MDQALFGLDKAFPVQRLTEPMKKKKIDMRWDGQID